MAQIILILIIVAASLVNIYSWFTGVSTALGFFKKSASGDGFTKNVTQGLYILFITVVDFFTVSVVRFLLGGAQSTVIAAATAVIGAVISISSMRIRKNNQFSEKTP